MRVPQIVTFLLKEKGMENKGEQRLFLEKPWCEHWSYWGWRKGTSRDEVTFNMYSEEIKPVAIAIIELRLPEGISQSVNQSVSQQKNLGNF